jgi:hypothetical protein
MGKTATVLFFPTGDMATKPEMTNLQYVTHSLQEVVSLGLMHLCDYAVRVNRGGKGIMLSLHAVRSTSDYKYTLRLS